MLVIHPNDPTTAFLSFIYEGNHNRNLYTEKESNTAIRYALKRKYISDKYIMMLGHGCEYGLFAPSSPDNPFGRLIINGSHVEFLRRQTCVAIWCNANLYAARYGLHGLFSGMIISEMSEAAIFQIPTTPEELAVENSRLAGLVKQALDACETLAEIPQFIAAHAPMDTPLQRFNYSSFYYFE